MVRITGPGMLLAVLLVAGCASTETRTYTMTAPTSAPATWTGRGIEDVVEAWGPPSARTSDGEGGTLLVYEETSSVGASVSEGATSPDLSPGAPGPPPKTESLKRVQAKFWIDGQGKVYRFWFSPEVYKKGTDTPPARKPKDEGAQRWTGPENPSS